MAIIPARRTSLFERFDRIAAITTQIDGESRLPDVLGRIVIKVNIDHVATPDAHCFCRVARYGHLFERALAVGEHPVGDLGGQLAGRRQDEGADATRRGRAAGGEAVWLDGATTLDEVVRRCYPDAKSVASALPEVTLATVNPDRVEDPRELVDIDLGVVSGAFGVAENGAVWIPQDIRHKALYFGATALMVVIPRDALVDTMHEALARPELDDFEYGCFMSGPSKTADIEQALVFGAHGPMSITVVLR